MPEVMRSRRTTLAMSQADLAERVGIDKRQIRRYEAGEAQPSLTVARGIADALGISLDELAGSDTKRVGLNGDWWASRQTIHNGEPVQTIQPVTLRQRGDLIQIAADDRGITPEEGGYLWRGELRLWDNEALMGWYTANDDAVRSKGTMFFHIHTHGRVMLGRWVGLSHDGPVITGWAALAKSEDEAREAVNDAITNGDNA
jgi:DNA-binding XRE family transcriptional regulator